MELFVFGRVERSREMSLLLLLGWSLLSLAAFSPETDAGEGVPPKLSEDVETRITVREDTKSFRLNCPVTGQPPPLILWKKDGEMIGIEWHRFRPTNSGKVLRIKNLMLEDSGQYTCEAVNGFGRKDVQFTLIVYGKDEPEPEEGDFTFPPGSSEMKPFWVKPEEMRVAEEIVKQRGEEVKMACPASGLPSPDIQWFKNSVPIHAGRGSQPTRYSYQLKGLTETDAGTYVCRVYNAHGAINASFTVRVSDGQDPPEFQTAHPLNTTVQTGDSASFFCVVHSRAQPHIKWLKKIEKDHPVEDKSGLFSVKGMDFMVLGHESHMESLPNHTYRNQLVIPNVQHPDSGWYVCVVTSPAGHIIYKFARLDVRPVLKTALGDSIPSAPVAVGLCVGFFLLILISCAIFFFRKSVQPKPEGMLQNGRPPPPSFQPPNLPQKLSPSPYFKPPNSDYYHRDNGRYIRTNERQKQRPGDYHMYDPQARVPLNPMMDERDLYETTPQPYEIDYEHSDVEYLPPENGRLQPYPSLYSCR